MQYKTGTVSTTNGSAIVTGSGTSWLANVAVGDLFALQLPNDPYNVAYEVGSVDSNTQITLTAPFNATVAGSAYVLHRDFHPNGNPKFANGDVETAAILNRWTLETALTADLGTAAALDAQTSLTDTTPDTLMKTGAGGWLIPQTIVASGSFNDLIKPAKYWVTASSVTDGPDSSNAFIVDVSGGDSGANKRYTQTARLISGAGEIAIYERTFRTESGWTAWQRIDPQAFGVGLGGSKVSDLITDLTQGWSTRKSGMYRVNPSTIGIPTGFSQEGTVIYTRRADSSDNFDMDGALILMSVVDSTKRKQTEIWVNSIRDVFYQTADWIKVYTQASILGTVSQSGGVPTGAVIERGSNANGEYVKFADGTMICTYSSGVLASTSIVTPMAGGFRSSGLNFTYPSAFTSSPSVAFHSLNLNALVAASNVDNPAGGNVVFWAAAPATVDVAYKYVAIGRWF